MEDRVYVYQALEYNKPLLSCLLPNHSWKHWCYNQSTVCISVVLHTHWNSCIHTVPFWIYLNNSNRQGIDSSHWYRWRCHPIQRITSWFCVSRWWWCKHSHHMLWSTVRSRPTTIQARNMWNMCVPSCSEVCNNAYCHAVRKPEENFSFTLAA